ncbi:MAG: tandem-95 repeat protein, partial [Hyphomicrobium sp.]
MNKPVRPVDLAAANAKPKSVDELLRGFKSGISYRTLEPRIAFDGAAVATAAAVVDAPAATDGGSADAAHTDRAATPDASGSDSLQPAGDDTSIFLEAAAAVGESTPGPTSIAFIDQNVEDIDAIVAGIDPSTEIVLLDGSKSGVDQIASYLSGRTDVGSIHIFSHGEAGRIYLGTDTLDEATLSQFSDQLLAIGETLSVDGDILIYGCNVAEGDGGAELVRALANMTGADIAASDDATGYAGLGGDWVLEVKAGQIDVSTVAVVDWEHVMAPVTVTALNGTTVTATTLADNISGSGVTVVGASYTGDNSQAGTFTSATGYSSEWLAYDSGVVLSTGSATSHIGANTATNTTVDAPGTGTDADFTLIGGGTSFDTSAMTINFIPDSNQITLQFTFGSEEYNEYVYANFNDAIGVWVNGVHVSLTPSGQAIAIDTINQAATYNPANGNLANDPNPTNGVYDSASPSLFINNAPNAGTFTTRMDGFTVTLSLVANVNVGVVNTIRLGVSDIGDASYDSWLFVKENSLQSTTIANTDFATTTTNTAVTINALANDYDMQGDALTITHVTDKPIIAGGPAITLATGATVQLTAGGQLLFTPATGQAGTENFSYTISDGNGTTAVGFVNVSIGANSAPIVDLNDNGTSAGRDNSVAYTEGGAAVAVATATASVIDSNDISFPSASVALAGFQANGSEVLNIAGTAFTFGTAQTSIVVAGTISVRVTYDGASTITFANAAPDTEIPKASLNTLIRSITYQHSGDNVTTGNRTLSFTVSDGQALSNTAVATIAVTGTNDAPVNTLPANFTAGSSAPIALNGLAIADADAQGGVVTTTLSVTSGTLTATSGGGVTVTGSGSSSIVLTGTVAQINAFLAGSAPTFATSNVGPVTLTMVTNDGGNTGSGGALSDTDTSTITVVGGPVVDLNSTPTPSVVTGTTTSNLVTGGTFGTTASAAPAAPWTESGNAGAGAVVVSGGSGRFDWTTSPTGTLTQPIAVPADTSVTTHTATATTVVTTHDEVTNLSFDLAWQNQDATRSNTLTVSYAGVTYATFTTLQGGTANAAGLVGTWTYSNGASGPATTNSVTDEVTGALSTINIVLPSGITASGNLVFTYAAGTGAGTGHDDIAIDNVVVTSTRLTTTTTTTSDTADNGWTATYQENGAPVSIADTDSSIFDGDDTNMESATITLTNSQTGDRLLVNGSAGATGTIGGITWTRTDTTVTFTGSATKAQYAAALQQVQFENTTDTPAATPRTINVIVNDGTVNSNTAVTTINIDRAPDPTNDAFSGNEDTAISANVLANDTDTGDGPAAPPLALVTGPANGVLTSFNLTTGEFVYTPTGNFNGTDTFTYRYTDVDGDSKTATVTLTVNAVNDAPTQVVPASIGPVAEDATLAVTGITVADVDSAALTTTLTVTNGRLNLASLAGVTVTGDGTGTMTIAGTAAAINAALTGLTFTATADYNGTAAFTVTTTDGIATSSTDSRTITVSSVVDIANDSASTNEDAAVTFAPLSNDSFENAGRTITAINGSAITAGGPAVVLPGVGTVTLDVSGNLTFTPVANYNGTPSFSYTVTSGGVTETATVNLTVNAVNDAPTQTLPVAQTTNEDVARVISGASVADVDGGTLTTTLSIPGGTGVLAVVTGGGATITGNNSGTVTISGTPAQINAAIASITYTPTADFNGSAPLSISTTDGTATASGSVSVTVTAVADITNDAVTTNEDTARTFNVVTGTNGATADTFEGAPSVTSITQPANGSVTFTAAGSMTYTPSANFSGTDTFTYTVTSGGVTETATVTVTVTAVNDAPVNTVPGAQTAPEDTSIVFNSANGNAITVADVDSNVTTTLTVANGALTLGSIAGVTVTGNGTGTVTVSGTPAAITAAMSGLTFAPTADWNGATTLNVSTSDGVAPATVNTVGITVLQVVDIAPNSVSTVEDTASTFNVLTNDSFENPGSIVSSVTQPANGSVTIGVGGNVTYTPNVNYNGSDSFTYTVTSGGVTETTTVTMTITAVNDAPVADDETGTATEDTTLTVPAASGLLVGDTDVDGNPLTVTQFTVAGVAGTFTAGSPAAIPGVGTLTINGDGSYTFVPAANYNGAVPVATYTVDDGNGGTDTGTLTIAVTPVNDAPVADDETGTATEDTTLTVPAASGLLVGDTDVDGNPLTVTQFSVAGVAGTFTAGSPAAIPGVGTLTINGDGSYTFVPAANYNGAVPVATYTVDDGNGG